MAKIGFVSLGCAKNLVDTEVMLGKLSVKGHELTASQEEADIIVVNTCGFIDRAKEESVNTILEMAELKTTGSCQRLVVAGCLVERYRAEILESIPEVDAVIGINEIPKIIEACGLEEAVPPTYEARELYLYSDQDERVLTTPRHWAYVKIAEGCDHPCTFCVIPKMRGRFRSRPIDSVVREVRSLASGGVREVNLVAQDSTMYGWDLGDRKGLAKLLRELSSIDEIGWIRFLYAYPNSIYDELLEAIAESPKVCKYIDLPLQNASRNVLARMKRGGNRGSLTRLLGRIREAIPEVTLRTTMIVGFPGETESDFRELVEFVEEIEFDRLGVFTYSDEEHGEAYNLDQKVPDEVRSERLDRLMSVQRKISKRKNRSLVGQTLPILVEGLSQESDLLWEGRLPGQAPEIDGVVYLNDGVTEETVPGEIHRVRITEAHEYDLVGTLVT
ncbi:MAG: 30S ribosomal protein S12 methylthiotransferase RimO [Acidobacteriota bacterium]|nr:MAG: 30S ribosomal protein S12 methylthiotransferase RimO [Acidobacteriota bacterium]